MSPAIEGHTLITNAVPVSPRKTYRSVISRRTSLPAIGESRWWDNGALLSSCDGSSPGPTALPQVRHFICSFPFPTCRTSRRWTASKRTVFHRLDDFVGGPNRVREIGVVDKRGGITVTPFGMLGRGSCVFRDSYLETLLE